MHEQARTPAPYLRVFALQSSSLRKLVVVGEYETGWVNKHKTLWVDEETGTHERISASNPRKCAATANFIAVETNFRGVSLHSRTSDRVKIPDSNDVYSMAFHPKESVLALGYKTGCVMFWDLRNMKKLTSIQQHSRRVTHVGFTLDGRLLLSSYDKTASITSLSSCFEDVSCTKLRGHADAVNDIIHIFNNRCVTASVDKTIRIWDSQTGATQAPQRCRGCSCAAPQGTHLCQRIIGSAGHCLELGEAARSTQLENPWRRSHDPV